MDKFQNKYRIASARAQWWDYGWNGAYFITICTQNREHFFGKIVDSKFIPSQIGQLAKTIWHEIPNKFQYVELGDFVVMPNHIHGILILDKPDGNTNHGTNDNNRDTNDNNRDKNVQTRLIASFAETRLIASLQTAEQNQNQTKTGGFAGNKNPMINDNISRIIRWYKGRCSFEIKNDEILKSTTYLNAIKQDEINWQKFHDKLYDNFEKLIPKPNADYFQSMMTLDEIIVAVEQIKNNSC
jgi:putative transposase